MKATGVTRPLDQLGRIVIPKELRKVMDITSEDSFEIFTESDQIILKKYHPSCVFCNDARDVILFKGKLVCRNCIEGLKLEPVIRNPDK